MECYTVKHVPKCDKVTLLKDPFIEDHATFSLHTRCKTPFKRRTRQKGIKKEMVNAHRETALRLITQPPPIKQI